jgi:hypothetical protein
MIFSAIVATLPRPLKPVISRLMLIGISDFDRPQFHFAGYSPPPPLMPPADAAIALADSDINTPAFSAATPP